MKITPSMLVQQKEASTGDPEEFDIGIVLEVNGAVAEVHWFRAKERHTEHASELRPAYQHVARNLLRWAD